MELDEQYQRQSNNISSPSIAACIDNPNLHNVHPVQSTQLTPTLTTANGASLIDHQESIDHHSNEMSLITLVPVQQQQQQQQHQAPPPPPPPPPPSMPLSTPATPQQPSVNSSKSSSEKLDEIFDIVCKNEGFIKEPSALTKRRTNNRLTATSATKGNTNRFETKLCCDLCNKFFSAERYYKQHYNSVHLHSGPKRYKCMLCQRSFYTEKKLQKHIDHEMYKPHNCQECERTFHRKPDLIRHSYVHRKAKPFTCNACQKSFIRADQLTSHHKNCTAIANKND